MTSVGPGSLFPPPPSVVSTLEWVLVNVGTSPLPCSRCSTVGRGGWCELPGPSWGVMPPPPRDPYA